MLGEEKGHDELALKKEWMAEARGMTLEKLPDFLKKLTEFDHDYGTICRAIAAGAIGTAHAMNKAPGGGITGFQAGCVMWDLITGWMSEYDGKPVRLVNYENMLYPQYQDKFEKLISIDTWEWLQSEAKKRLESSGEHMHERVLAHLDSIAAGNLPFGYGVKHD